jgi:hypothetical protein
MKKVIIIFVVAGLFGLSCKKELSHNISKEDEPEVEVIAEDGGAIDDLSKVEKNDHSLYTFGGVAGLYFGCTSTFKMSGKGSLDITFGTELTTELKVTQRAFEQLIKEGDRSFGSLGSYTTFPGIDSAKVEIAYTDKNSKRWCSTRITEKLTSDGMETSVKLDQNQSTFKIDSIQRMNDDNGSYRLKGHFECFLYEVNGDAKIKIKGHFQGVVSIIVQ